MLDEIDRPRVEGLAQPMLEAIRANYLRGPVSRDRVLEALNALALCAATVITGTGDRTGRRQAQAFLDKAVDQNITMLLAAQASEKARH